MIRIWRQVASLLGMVAIVFAQLAVSAHACPMTSPASAQAAMSLMSDPCDQAHPAQSNLCDKHCHDSQQSQDGTAGLPGAFVPGFIANVRMASPPTASHDDPALRHATSQPATIRNRCLRI